MLILTRRTQEKILINDNIEICIVGIKGKQVKLGFAAPDDVKILRQELTYKPLVRKDATAPKIIVKSKKKIQR